MIISCECLNVVVTLKNATTTITTNVAATNNSQQQKHQPADGNSVVVVRDDNNQNEVNFNNLSKLYGVNMNEMQKLQKSNKLYEGCLEFFKQSTGPLNNIQENINQPELIIKVPIKPWILNYCINCNTITHAKQINSTLSSSSSSATKTTSSSSSSSPSASSLYLINSKLIKNSSDELNYIKSHQSFSDTFGILINDRPRSPLISKKSSILQENNDAGINNINDCNTIQVFNKDKQIRIKNLTDKLNKRLQKEIYETDERIRRYTEQQFALLKIYREKSEQELQIILNLINQQVPDDDNLINKILMIMNDSDYNNGDNNNAMASDNNLELINNDNVDVNNKDIKYDNEKNTSNTTSLFNLKHQQILNLDTPPATPDSTPMSVGNSPTFRQQQQQQQQTTINSFNNSNDILNGKMKNNNNSTMMMVIGNDTDCLFELEGMETGLDSSGMNATIMSDDCEEAEDAEDALGELNGMLPSVQIPQRSNLKKSNSYNNSIAKSLPITITNVPERKFYFNELEDEEIPEDANIDIAASIKALAKSVHGDTVFGDLPRPRFSTQI